VNLQSLRKEHISQTPHFIVGKPFHRMLFQPFDVAEITHATPQIASLDGIKTQN
jgi:hypothetical protein